MTESPETIFQPEIKFPIVTQPTLLCCLLKMGVMDIRQENASHSPAEKVKHFLRNWQTITSDQWVLNCVKGYEIDWVAQPSQTQMPRELVFSKTSTLPLTGSGEPCAEEGDIRSMPTSDRDVKRERLCLSAVCSAKEGRRHQTSCEPEGSQFIRQAGIFQNGTTSLKLLFC